MATDEHPDFEQLLDALRTFDSSELTPAECRDQLAMLERVRCSAEAAQASVMVRMLHEAQRQDAADDAFMTQAGSRPVAVHTGAREEFVVDEIALHLRCTRVAASHRFATALAAHEHSALAAAWSAGRIDARKVQIIGDAFVEAEPAFTASISDAALDYAATHTGPQLRAWLLRRVIAANPTAAEQRRERATAARRVTFIPLPDGVAELSALMPAGQARRIFDTLTALAHAADGEDARDLDQRRSDALFDLTCGNATPPRIHLAVTVPAAVLTGTSDAPGDLAGYGPITADAARELTAPENCSEQTWRRLLTDPATGVLTDLSETRYRPSAPLDRAVRARDLTCRFPGCRRPATSSRSGVDLDHTTPWPEGDTSAANLACLCRHHHRLKHSPGWQLTSSSNGTLTWTTPTGHTFATRPWQYHDPPDEHAEDLGEAA
ncbi:MAG: hypothetical protein ACJ73J_08850 [Actinomycetes bacterium]